MRIRKKPISRRHIGTASTNALTVLIDTINLLAELANQCATHTLRNGRA
ncbi:hypothetical protein [Phytobacter sp. V91]